MKLTEEQKIEIARRHREGETFASLGLAFGVSYPSLRLAVQTYGEYEPRSYVAKHTSSVVPEGPAVSIERPGDWAEHAACAGTPLPDLWFANENVGRAVGHSADVRAALETCAGCPVRNACLQYALGVDPAHDWGVWGGTTERERRRLRKTVAA